MKKYIALLITLVISISSFAQIGFNYKALIKDDLGNVVANQNVDLRFTLEFIDEEFGSVITFYIEEHNATTNSEGIVVLNIGEGNVIVGSFPDDNWIESTSIIIEIDIETDGTFVTLPTANFKKVPMALHANRAERADLATFAISANNVSTKIDDLSDGKSENNGSSIFVGIDAGRVDNGNNENVGFGFNTLYSNNIGSSNSAVGYQALFSNTDGQNNVAVGNEALYSNTTPSGNTAIGADALKNHVTGPINTAVGIAALSNSVTGENNTAVGGFAMRDNTVGYGNTATGRSSLFHNTEGYNNTATGQLALYLNTSGHGNLASSYRALYNNTNGHFNVGIGQETLFLNTSGDNNTALGYGALTGITTGNNNLGIGFNAEVPSGTASNQVRIGDTNISYAGIQVDWSITSDRRWKDSIRELPYGLDMLMQLQPVDYTRKNNTKKTREMGFIAQDVEALLEKIGYTDQGFLTKDDNGYLSVRYNDFIALLTKAMQEQQQIIESQKLQIDSEKLINKKQSNSLEALLKRVENLENRQSH